MSNSPSSFLAITSEGGLLPADFLQELLNKKSEIEGLDPKSYDLAEGEKISEQVERSWRRLKGCWDNFKRSIADRALDEATTTETRERWLLPLFQELGFGKLKAAKPLEIDGKSYAISHGIQLGHGDEAKAIYVPIHLVGSHLDLDRRTPGATGAAKSSPHSLVQQMLNAKEQMLWGLTSNGYSLRLLRDNAALTRLSLVEFDLQQIFDGDLYPEFYVLWLVCHRSRFEGERPELCRLEQWRKTANDKGLRALENLKPGVVKAIASLGAGLVGHKKNDALREKLRTGALTPVGLYQQILRVVYRVLFLLVAEERDLLHPEEDSDANRKCRKRYKDFYSISRLRDLTLHRAGTPHPDLWQVLQLVTDKLGSDTGAPELALPAIGSFLWDANRSTPDLQGCLVSNRHLIEAVHALVFVQDGNIRRAVDYRNLGAEELGSVYEGLLELHPEINPDVGSFELKIAAGNERKTSGSYYTPDSLVQCLLDSALEPVIEERLKVVARVANCEWRVARENLTEKERADAYRILSGSGCVATGTGDGQDGIRHDPSSPGGRAILTDQPNAAVGGVGALEYSGGMGATLPSGVHSIPAEGQRESNRIGNPTHPLPGSGIPEGGGGPDDPEGAGDSRQKVVGARAQFDEANGERRIANGAISPADESLIARLWDRTPFATRYSLLAPQALLRLRVCDPASGSGHFIIAAAHRMARRLALLRSGGDEPSPSVYRTALRDVIGHCLYAVDINPMAAELCKVNLWIEAMEPGKPLSFLDHHIQVGNSLLGTTPGLIARGIPDEAFEPIEGDDKEACSFLRKRNKAEREGFGGLFAGEDAAAQAKLRQAAAAIDEIDDDRPEHIRQKEAAFRDARQNSAFRRALKLANIWCAAFVIKKRFPESAPRNSPILPIAAAATATAVQGGLFGGTEETVRMKPKKGKAPARAPTETPTGITSKHLRDLVEGQAIDERVLAEARMLAEEYQFFHWHLAFPEVFQSLETIDPKDSKGWKGGFDVILGNPPWERVKLEEKQWFETKAPEIANASTAAIRKRMIKELVTTNPALLREFQNALRVAEAESRFLRDTGRFARSGVGDVNTFAVFTELAVDAVSDRGLAGIIIPTGLLTDDQLKGFSSYLVESGRLIAVYGFENEEFLFEGIANVVRFCAIAISGPVRPASSTRMAFYMRRAEHLNQEERFFQLSPADLGRLNPKTRTCPIFRTRYDAELTLKLYEKFPLLGPAEPSADGWGVNYLRMFDMANDSGLFLTEPSADTLPLYEAKLLWHYDHRFGSYDLKGKLKGKGGRGLPDMPLELHQDPNYSITTQFWVSKAEVSTKLDGVWAQKWFAAYRTTSSAKLERTVVCAVLPYSAVNHKAPLILPKESLASDSYLLLSCLNSIVLDYIARQKVGGTDIGYFHLDQLPIPSPPEYSNEQRTFLRTRVLELTYTAWDIQPFAKDLDYSGPPFRWDPERRFRIQCEIDAFYAHLYGLSREELLFILDPHELHGPDYPGESFRVLKEKETERYGTFRTRDTILAIYDAMTESIRTGQPFETRLSPAPMSITVTHRPRIPTTKRPSGMEPIAYLSQFILSYIARHPNGVNILEVSEACALLASKSLFVARLKIDVGEELSEAWSRAYTDNVEARAFRSVLMKLREMDAISFTRHGDTVNTRIEAHEGLPHPEWIELDVTLVQRVQASLPKEDITTIEQPLTTAEVLEFVAAG